MLGIFQYVMDFFLLHITNAFTYITDAIDLFIVYISAEVPFLSFCMSVFFVVPQPVRDICYLSVTAMFIAFLFNALRRGK